MATEAMCEAIHKTEQARKRGEGPKDLLLTEAVTLEELLSRLARRMFVLVPDHPTTKMSVNQLRTCSILQHGPRAVSDLARDLGVTVSNLSQIAERMVRIGLVERYETRDDRRLRLLKLTPQGQQVMESRKHHRIECAVGALTKVDPDQRQEILHALQSLVEAATAASPLRVLPAAAPDWVTRVVREADLTT